MPMKPIRVCMRNSDRNRSSLSLTSRFQLACMRAAARTARKTVSSNYSTPGIKPSYRGIGVHARAHVNHGDGRSFREPEIKKGASACKLPFAGKPAKMRYEQTVPPTVVL